jgi:DNA-binding response OmpR family regulator
MPTRGTVLVIDDDTWIGGVIADFLRDEGFAVEQVADGNAGLLMAELVQPDVVLLDLAMPVRSGLDVLRQMKQRESTRAIPVIIVSAYATLLVRDQSDRPDAFLQRPIDLKELLGRVNRIVRQAHPRFRLLPPTCAPSEPVLTGEWSSPEPILPFAPIILMRLGAALPPHA